MTLSSIILYSQSTNPLDEMLFGDTPDQDNQNKTTLSDSVSNDIIRINYAKKNAQLAMIMSALLPGSGQLYADKSAITAYIFPVIELAVIGGMVYYNNQGKQKTKDYKKYATEDVTLQINDYTYSGPRYRRDFQQAVQDTLISIHTYDIYDGLYFSLDLTDTQHFFEDIGKYDKYIFGWVDWYFEYAEIPPIGDAPSPHPIFVFDISNPSNPLYNSPDNKWKATISLLDGTTQSKPSSTLRSEYIQMRKDAEDEFKMARNISFGLAFNHIAAAIDAARVTRKVNRFYISDLKIKLNYYTAVKSGSLTPMLGINYSF